MSLFNTFNQMESFDSCKLISTTLIHRYFQTYKPYWKTQSKTDLDFMNKQLDGLTNWLWLLAKKHQLDSGILYTGFYYFATFSLFQIEESDPDAFLKQKMQNDFRETTPISLTMWSMMKFQMWELAEIRKLLGVCLWIASKYHQDCNERYVASYWSTCTGIPHSMMTRLETHIITILQFQLFVSDTALETMKLLCFQTNAKFTFSKLKVVKKSLQVGKGLLKYVSLSKNSIHSQSMVRPMNTKSDCESTRTC